MSFKASIEVDGKTWRVISCQYTFRQPINLETGLPIAHVQGGTIDLEIESTGDLTFIAWMLDPKHIKNGTITYFQRDGEQKLKDIKFKNGFVVSYKENFNNHGEDPMTESITISSEEFIITSSIRGGGEVNHKNYWASKM